MIRRLALAAVIVGVFLLFVAEAQRLEARNEAREWAAQEWRQ
jgi:hypothetical protein